MRCFHACNGACRSAIGPMICMCSLRYDDECNTRTTWQAWSSKIGSPSMVGISTLNNLHQQLRTAATSSRLMKRVSLPCFSNDTRYKLQLAGTRTLRYRTSSLAESLCARTAGFGRLFSRTTLAFILVSSSKASFYLDLDSHVGFFPIFYIADDGKPLESTLIERHIVTCTS